MKRTISIFALLLVSLGANAAATDEVVARIEKHWEARNAMDYKAQYEMVASGDTLNANSDGSFFTLAPRGTLEELEENLAGIKMSNVAVHYPQAMQLSDTVVLAWYYLEGQIEFADGSKVSNYRTRVSQVFVQEDGAWKHKSWHFSALHQGGVFQN